jgi:hypothetical protein
MSDTYNHLLVLTEKNIDDIMYGKDSNIQGFYTKLPTKSEKTDFTEIKENIAWYNIRFADSETIVKNNKNICISISEKNQDLFDFIYDSLEEEIYKKNKYSFKIDEDENQHFIVVTTLEYFDKSKMFV